MTKLSIAVIGWGSLIWDPRDLAISDAGWRPDGPLLPVEFLRISGLQTPPKKLTLVLADTAKHTWVQKVRTLWAMSSADNLPDAVRNLGKREAPNAKPEDVVGCVLSEVLDPDNKQLSLKSIDEPARKQIAAEIRAWLGDKGLDAAIWTDLPPNADSDGQAITLDSAVPWLRRLQRERPDDAKAARAYIEHTPIQVMTQIRGLVELALKWTPKFMPSPIRSGDDIRFKEWSEARTTIGRFDSILVDLRKVGFTIITTLVGASTFLGFLIPATPTVAPAPSAVPAPVGASGPTGALTVVAAAAASTTAWPVEARGAVWIMLIALVVLLFTVDAYYEALLSGAVERAMDIEWQTDPPVRLSKYLSVNIKNVWGAQAVFWMYAGLLVVVDGLTTGMFFLATTDERSRVWWWLFPPVLLSLGYVIAYFFSRRPTNRPDTLKARPWPEGEGKEAAPDLTLWRNRPGD